MSSLSHPFTLERNGRPYHLVKHPRDRKLPVEEQNLRPWYVRVPVIGEKNERLKKVGEAHELEASVAAARDLLLKARAGGNPFTELYEAGRYRAALTVGSILEAWVGAGCPEPNGSRRSDVQQGRQTEPLKIARAWWDDKSAASITGPTLHAYALWRRGQARAGSTGDRSIDIDLTVLSNAFAWAVAMGKTDINPFLKRPRFRRAEDIDHCNQFMPADDSELHRICGALMASADASNVVAGAQLLFQALTGLRPGEPGLLRWDARYVDGRPGPGYRYHVTLEGKRRELLAVHRLKGGINPAVEIHPVLEEFLRAWQPYAQGHFPGTPFIFPDPAAEKPFRPFVDPEDGRKRLVSRLNAAVEALGLAERHPHAMRAFYVRVRRSHGYRDAVIAEELGQGSGPKEIVRCYGDPRGIFGDGRYDWRPESGEGHPKLAWEVLAKSESNTVALPAGANRDTELDTGRVVPESPEESHKEKSACQASGL